MSACPVSLQVPVLYSLLTVHLIHASLGTDAELLGGSVEVGNRGGINVRGEQLKITLDAE
jgi:hypothetical protein